MLFRSLMVTKYGQCIRFSEKDVRSTGRTSMGVRGMNLSDRDEVIGMQLDSQGSELLIVSEKGMGKRTDMIEFTRQNRGGKGVKCYKITEKTGNVVGVKAVNEDDEIMIINTEGIIIRMKCEGISVLGRITSGVKLINLKEGDIVASIAKVRKGDEGIPPYPQLISKSLFDKVQSIRKKRKKAPKRKSKNRFLLKGLLYEGNSGRSLCGWRDRKSVV